MGGARAGTQGITGSGGLADQQRQQQQRQLAAHGAAVAGAVQCTHATGAKNRYSGGWRGRRHQPDGRTWGHQQRMVAVRRALLLVVPRHGCRVGRLHACRGEGTACCSGGVAKNGARFVVVSQQAWR
jgi:hypothetical protein